MNFATDQGGCIFLVQYATILPAMVAGASFPIKPVSKWHVAKPTVLFWTNWILFLVLRGSDIANASLETY